MQLFWCGSDIILGQDGRRFDPWRLAWSAASGIGPARNAIIARACVALIAVGGGVGTLSEMALGLQFGRLVMAMAGAPAVEGVAEVAGVDEAIDRLAGRIFGVM